MLKYLLIASLLVNLAQLLEVVPEQSELLTNNVNVDQPKKYHNHEERTHHHHDKKQKDYKHKKYYSNNEEKQDKYYDGKYKNIDKPTEEKYYNGKKHYYDDSNGEKHYKGKSEYYTKRKDSHEKYHEAKRNHVDNEHLIAVSQPEPPNMLPIDMKSDTDINNKLIGKAANPNSEMIPASYIKKDFYKEMKKVDLSKVPNANETILMARYIVHNVDWAALATLTTRTGGKHSPYANIISMSDGPVDQSSGVPFFYMTPMDLSSKDLSKENKASVTVTLAQTPYCRQQNFDPEDPRCARVTLSGKIKNIKADTLEEEFAKKAMFTRHPVMESWPKDHDFHLVKLKIGQIVLLDQFGGPKYLDVEEYLNAGEAIP